jgi:leucyl aminopeptidase (aminopeptidase T)
MKNAGGQFPIGEVFTEPKDIKQVSGKVNIFAFGDNEFKVNLPSEPIELTIEEGKIVSVARSTPEFDAVLNEIKEGGEAVVRELGFGMNKAFTRHRTVPDVGSYERMCGIHLSLGGKHAIYAKEGFSRKHSRFHVDVFADVKTVTIDDEIVYDNGAWQIKNPR